MVFCFDGDKAGRNAALRALDAALGCMNDGRTVKFLFLPEGEDPDTLVRQVGPDKFERLIELAVPLEDYLFDAVADGLNIRTMEGRASFSKRAAPLLERLPRGVFRELMFDSLATRTGLNRRLLDELISAQQNAGDDYIARATQDPQRAKPAQQEEPRPAMPRHERDLGFATAPPHPPATQPQGATYAPRRAAQSAHFAPQEQHHQDIAPYTASYNAEHYSSGAYHSEPDAEQGYGQGPWQGHQPEDAPPADYQHYYQSRPSHSPPGMGIAETSPAATNRYLMPPARKALALLLSHPQLANLEPDHDTWLAHPEEELQLLGRLLKVLHERPHYNLSHIIGYWRGTYGPENTEKLAEVAGHDLLQAANALTQARPNKPARADYDAPAGLQGALSTLKQQQRHKKSAQSLAKLKTADFTSLSKTEREQLVREALAAKLNATSGGEPPAGGPS